MFADHVDPLPRVVSVPGRPVPVARLAGLGLLLIALVIGLTTAADYGFSIDEFNTDDYGPKALAWYTSGFTDRSHFDTVEEWLWAYGPWAQMLIAAVQSWHVADPVTVRHAATFTIGVAGLAALLPLARMTIGAWGGPVAILLCLTTGYLYGSLFFTPIDVPFLAAMTWALAAVVAMARHRVPPWRATLLCGLATGLAIATRTGGIITHAYLVLAMALCATEALLSQGRAAKPVLIAIAVRTVAAMALAWVVAIALWPWLQIGNPLRQFAIAYAHFATIQAPFSFRHWGETIATNALPWSYIPAQLLARLPEGFLLLLAASMVIGLVAAVRFAADAVARTRTDGPRGLGAPLLALARGRGMILLIVAALLPPVFVIVNGSTLYDGIRHLLFVIPLLALLAAGTVTWLLPLLSRRPMLAAAAALAGTAHVVATVLTMAALHPLQYVALNRLAGGPVGAPNRFEQDYWSAGATTALRQLQRQLDRDSGGPFAGRRARVLVCIPWREHMVAPLLPARFIAETDPAKADFLIGTERWDCGRQFGLPMVDSVARMGRSFAWIYRGDPGKLTPR